MVVNSIISRPVREMDEKEGIEVSVYKYPMDDGYFK